MKKELILLIALVFVGSCFVGCTVAHGGSNSPSNTELPSNTGTEEMIDTPESAPNIDTEEMIDTYESTPNVDITQGDKPMNQYQKYEYMLFVNDEKVELDNCFYFTNPSLNTGYYEVPLVEVLKALGAVIEWESDSMAKVSLMNKTYSLNLSMKSLISSDGFDYLLPPPGTMSDDVKHIEKELIIPENYLTLFLEDIGYRLKSQGLTLSIAKKN